MYKLEHYIRNPKKLHRALELNQPIRPLSVKIKLTWQCNLACVFCSDWRIKGEQAPRPQYFDSWEKLKFLLDELIALKTKKVHFSGGEPLMFPWIVQAVQYLTDAGKHSSMVSNGTLWTRAMAQQLFNAGLGNTTFSVDSPNESTFIALRGRKSWAQMQSGIRNARATVDQLNRPIKLKSNTVITRHNYKELVDLPDFAHQLGIDRIRLLPVDDLHCAEDLKLSLAQIQDYNQHIAPIIFEKAQKLGLVISPRSVYVYGRTPKEIQLGSEGHYALGYYENHHCFTPWLHSLISADGRVFACCMLKSEKQHIDKISEVQGFTEVWHGQKYQAFRAQMQEKKPPICKHCDDYLPENQYLNSMYQLLKPHSRPVEKAHQA